MNVILYTVCVGGYDKPQPRIRERGLTNIILTDLPTRAIPQPWVRQPMPPKEKLCNRRWSRLPKLCPHHALPPHDVSIYADCNLQWTTVPILKWALDQVAHHSMAVFRHPSRKCVFSELETCQKLSFEYPENVSKQEAKLRAAGFPEDWGLTENCFIIRRNDPLTNRFNETWLDEYMNGPMRDQLTFMPTVWSSAYRPHLNIIEGNSRRNRFYQQVRHLKDRAVVGDLSVSRAQQRVLAELKRSRQNIHA